MFPLNVQLSIINFLSGRFELVFDFDDRNEYNILECNYVSSTYEVVRRCR